MEFQYQEPFPILKDDTQYKKLTSDYVKVEKLGEREIVTVDPKGLELLAEEALKDVSFMLRSTHLQKLKNIIDDPEATDNDRFVAYNLLQNASVAVKEHFLLARIPELQYVLPRKERMFIQEQMMLSGFPKEFIILTRIRILDILRWFR